MCDMTFENADIRFVEDVTADFRKLQELFEKKNEQYRREGDPLADFSTGARIDGYMPGYGGMFEVAKGYMKKHVAHLYNGGVDNDKVEESLGDIAVYCLIMRYMVRRRKGETLHGKND